MQKRWAALAGALGAVCVTLAAATPAGARCFADPYGGDAVCETINQARRGALLTASDATTLSPVTRAITIGDAAACNIAVVFADNSSAVTLANRQPGVDYPYAIKKLMSTNTTCAAVIALY